MKWSEMGFDADLDILTEKARPSCDELRRIVFLFSKGIDKLEADLEVRRQSWRDDRDTGAIIASTEMFILNVSTIREVYIAKLEAATPPSETQNAVDALFERVNQRQRGGNVQGGE